MVMAESVKTTLSSESQLGSSASSETSKDQPVTSAKGAY
jgi:hypothetical protein